MDNETKVRLDLTREQACFLIGYLDCQKPDTTAARGFLTGFLMNLVQAFAESREVKP